MRIRRFTRKQIMNTKGVTGYTGHDRPIGSAILGVALLTVGGLAGSFAMGADATVVLDTSATYQTIRSWGVPPWFGNGSAANLRVRPSLLDECVQTLGGNEIRVEINRREWEGALNDNGDPFLADPAAYVAAEADIKARTILLPMKQRVEADGGTFEFYVSPSFFDGGSSGSAPAWLLNSPGEYAEWAMQFVQYMQKTYGLVPAFYSVCNEAGNNNAFSAAVVATMIKTLAPRFQAAGLPVMIQFMEGVNSGTTWNYIKATQNDSEMWQYVGLVSYHLYGPNNPMAQQIRDFAWAKGLPTAQTEHMGGGINNLYDDLTFGGVSTWEFYAIGDILPSNANGTWFSHSATFWNVRQVFRYVRRGSVRLGATSSDSNLRPLAFADGGKITVVLLNNTDGQARNVTIQGLASGSYGLSQTVKGAYQEMGLQTVPADGSVSINVPAATILTLYPHGANLPPIITDWKAAPAYLTLPAAAVTLSASAVDPDGDAIAFAWSVKAKPATANVTLAAPNAANCAVVGLSVAGEYLFALAVSDPTHTVSRELPLTVFDGRQPPLIGDLHNRLPAIVILPQNSTTLRAETRNYEGKALSGQWSVSQQPEGAAAALATPDANSCMASGLDVPGEYVFRFTAVDAPAYTAAKDLTVRVYPENVNPPTIANAEAKPAAVASTIGATRLTATVSDPDDDVVSSWWSVKSKPEGAKPVFAGQSAPNTAVSGLTAPGRYVFVLTAVDRSKVAAKEVIVTVGMENDVASRRTPKTPVAKNAGKTIQSADPPPPGKSGGVIAEGAVVGTVEGKGDGWIEIKSESGKTTRYIPEWHGGYPAQGGGPDKDIIHGISLLVVGDQVVVKWHVDNHVRIDSIEKLTGE